jgi:hypothetical protein
MRKDESRKPRQPDLSAPGRIVALALIALAVSGLAYLRFAPDAGSVSVPKGARAGDLALKPCNYGTERGKYAADCGTLVVAENRHDPKSRLIALPVTRIRARSGHAGAPVFRVEGGPGLSNMKFTDASRFADDRDVVLVGYRGVDGSVRLDCPEVDSNLKRSGDYLGQKFFDDSARACRACANRLRADGVDLAGYSLPERVDDLEAARRALGSRRIDLLSESAGTRTALIYGLAVPGEHQSIGDDRRQPTRQLPLEPADDGRADPQVQRALREGRLVQQANERSRRDPPDDSHSRPVVVPADQEGRCPHCLVLRVDGFDLCGVADLGADDARLVACGREGRPERALAPLGAATAHLPHRAGEGRRGRRLANRRRLRRSLLRSRRGSRLDPRQPGNRLPLGRRKARTAWPAGPDDNAYSRMRTSRVPTLLVGGNLDFDTPPQNATREQLAVPPERPPGRAAEPRAHERLLGLRAEGQLAPDQHLPRQREGRRVPLHEPAGRLHAQLHANGDRQDHLGAMVGLAALAILSLLWLPHRVHMRGGLGRKASASIRSLYVLVLGLGGWCAGALLALTTLPTVALDSDLLAGLSVGLPIGLGTYWAWVHRDWSPSTKTTGLAAALAAALVGAWLGFNSMGGLFAVLPAIVGATAGANLILLILDIARDRSARDLAAAATPHRIVAPAEL